ncbi:unnamed protein product [Victoria cruziana]
MCTSNGDVGSSHWTGRGIGKVRCSERVTTCRHGKGMRRGRQVKEPNTSRQQMRGWWDAMRRPAEHRGSGKSADRGDSDRYAADGGDVQLGCDGCCG